MKIISFIFLLVFAAVQIIPAISYSNCDTSIVNLIDEEKNTDKTDTDKKPKSDFYLFSIINPFLSKQINVAFNLSERILISPFFETVTPPPDFC